MVEQSSLMTALLKIASLTIMMVSGLVLSIRIKSLGFDMSNHKTCGLTIMSAAAFAVYAFVLFGGHRNRRRP